MTCYCPGVKKLPNFQDFPLQIAFSNVVIRMSTKHGSLSEQAVKRFQGGEMILNGYDNDEIAEILGVSLSSVKNWRRTLEDNDDDLDSLSRREGSGRIPKLTDKQKRKLKKIILKGAIAAGYQTERWTSKIVADVIQKRFGIMMASRTVRDLLPTLGLSPQKPVVKSYKHSDEAVVEWATRKWKRLKKSAKNLALP
jgi:transposase